MKKIYNAPKINVTELKASQMICASDGILSTSETDRITDSGSFGSRRGNSLWGDEDED